MMMGCCFLIVCNVNSVMTVCRQLHMEVQDAGRQSFEIIAPFTAVQTHVGGTTQPIAYVSQLQCEAVHVS
jgi:hypothetical protein